MAQVLTANPHENASPFSSSPLLHTSSPPPPAQAFYMPPSSYSDGRSEKAKDFSRSSSAPSSPQTYHGDLSRSSSFHSTPPSSLSLNAQYDQGNDEISFPSYEADDSAYTAKRSSQSDDQSPISSADSVGSTASEEQDSSVVVGHVADDTEIKDEPTRQVDYLSHEWREEDISCSWKYIVSKRKQYGERSRLENASWRTWTKSKYNLKTVSPERLNWLKDCDVTWLYGPLSQAHQRAPHPSEPPSRLSKSNSFVGGVNKKSNLKKRSVSEIMLQRSISSSSLVKQAAAAVEAQRRNSNRPSYSRSGATYFDSSVPSSSTTVDFSDTFASTPTSGVQSPGENRRHIRFDNKVEQCIAVDFRPDESEPAELQPQQWDTACYSASSSEDDMPMMKVKSRPIKTPSRVPSSRSSVSSESKGIAKLPSTTLRFHADEAEEGRMRPVPQLQQPYPPSRSTTPGPTLDKSPSQETLRPSRPSHNFLLDEHSEEGDAVDWTPGGAFSASNVAAYSQSWSNSPSRPSSAASANTVGRVETAEESGGLHRTGSGMFMPFEETDDDDNLVNNGIFGRVVDTVNTARDIAHVIWNVGWRK